VKRQPFLHAGAVLLFIAAYDLRYGSGTEKLAGWWFAVDQPSADQVEAVGLTVAAIIGVTFLSALLVARLNDRRSFDQFVARKGSAPALLDETKVSRVTRSEGDSL
jgi:hypothetical protein